MQIHSWPQNIGPLLIPPLSGGAAESQTNKIPTWLLQNELTAHSACARKFKILYLHVTWTYFHIIPCLPRFNSAVSIHPFGVNAPLSVFAQVLTPPRTR